MVGRRVDWLSYKLTTACVPYYWYTQVMKEIRGFKRNNDIEKVVENSFTQALKILDDYVTFIIARNIKADAFVRSISNPNQGQSFTF